MALLRRLAGSIVAQVTALTFGGLVLLCLLVAISAQTSLISWVFPKAVSDNANSIAELAWLVENFPEDTEYFILSAYRGAGRTAWVSQEFAPELQDRPALRTKLRDTRSDATARLEDRDVRFKRVGAWELHSTVASEEFSRLRAAVALQVSIALQDGRVLNVRLAPSVHLAQRPILLALVMWIGLIFALALGVALAFVTLRPIRSLERDAERIGLADMSAAVSETGPVELRRIAQALNRMRTRLAGLIKEREQMVAAIAHDIRTGLTRVRLRMEGKDTIAPEALEADLHHMEALIADMLAYARAESPSGVAELIRLPSFVEGLLRDAPTPVSLVTKPDATTEDFTIAGDPVALRRLFENLLENARRYGGGEAQLAVVQDDEGLELRIEDKGPGLPQDMLEAVFDPFVRVETSRSREFGGSGLGLSIARAIARAHGATLRLENRPQGGLAAIVWFPNALRT